MASPAAVTTPAQSALRFAMGLALGAALGLFYGFLRPTRRRFHAPADLIFVLAAFYIWLVESFLVCQGDIRLGYTAALALGAIGWEATVGKLLRTPFQMFWNGVNFPFRKISKIFSVILKKVFASAKKWVTIGGNRRLNRRRSGGKRHGAAHKTQA